MIFEMSFFFVSESWKLERNFVVSHTSSGTADDNEKNQLAKTKQPFLIFHARRTSERKLKICERVRQSLFSSSKMIQ